MSDEYPQGLVREFVIAAHSDLDRTQAMLAERPGLLDVPYREWNETALGAASHVGNRTIAEFLLARGAPMTICTAAMLGMTDRVRAFLEEDPSQARARGAHGIPVLFHAAMSGNTEIADLLVEHGGGEGAGSALHGAVAFGHLAMVEWLLARGPNPNAPDFAGKTPLRVALERGRAEIADALRRHGGLEEAPKA